MNTRRGLFSLISNAVTTSATQNDELVDQTARTLAMPLSRKETFGLLALASATLFNPQNAAVAKQKSKKKARKGKGVSAQSGVCLPIGKCIRNGFPHLGEDGNCCSNTSLNGKCHHGIGNDGHNARCSDNEDCNPLNPICVIDEASKKHYPECGGFGECRPSTTPNPPPTPNPGKGQCGDTCAKDSDCENGNCLDEMCRDWDARGQGQMVDKNEVCRCLPGLVPKKNKCANNGDGYECQPPTWTPPKKCKRKKKH
jgi:hypothetical protein